jgi:uncharacterized protein with gpF-like domain
VLIPAIGILIGTMFNKGRGLTFGKYGSSISAYRYTAVLDERTTRYCRELDGRVFQENDPNYTLLTPPNHYRCRSMWTPILPSEMGGVQVEGKPDYIETYSSVDTFKDLAEQEKAEAELISLMESNGQDKAVNS